MAQWTVQNIATQFPSGNEKNSPVMQDSAGYLYVVYLKFLGGNYTIVCARSIDAGQNWTEIGSIAADSSQLNIASAIDSSDVIHIAYENDTNDILTYNTFTIGTLTWGSPETVYDFTSNITSVDIAIDSSDIPHVIGMGGITGVTSIVYYNRSGGIWTGGAVISNDANDVPTQGCRIAINSQQEIYVVWRTTNGGAVTARIFYSKYNGSWSAPTMLDDSSSSVSTTFHPIGIAIDSDDNVHIVYPKTSTTTGVRHTKYVDATDTWTVSNIVTTGSYSDWTSIGVDSNDLLYVVNGDIIYTYNGSWDAGVAITNVDSYTNIYTPLYPILDGVHTQIPTSGYHLTFLDSSNIYKYDDGSTVVLPAPADKNYSRKAAAALPANDTNLDNLFTTAEYADVAAVDNDFATQSATDQYAIKLFKNKGNSSSDNIVVTWVGQSNIAPSTSTVYLQIYNRNTTTWETLDSNSTASAGGNFSLSGTKTTSLSNYYDGSNWVSCRVYQLAA